MGMLADPYTEDIEFGRIGSGIVGTKCGYPLTHVNHLERLGLRRSEP